MSVYLIALAAYEKPRRSMTTPDRPPVVLPLSIVAWGLTKILIQPAVAVADGMNMTVYAAKTAIEICSILADQSAGRTHLPRAESNAD